MRVCVRDMVASLLDLAAQQPKYQPYAHLFLMAYVFLLRVPSEAIPATAGGTGASSLVREGSFLVLRLARRKNRPAGSRLARGCWCKVCRRTCPLHVLGPILEGRKQGVRLFPGVTAGRALCVLREMLVALGVSGAEEFRTHDFRRGHAKDLQMSGVPSVAVCCDAQLCHAGVDLGAPLWQILDAGEWRSPAFLQYLDLHSLERDVVIQAHLGESEDENECA